MTQYRPLHFILALCALVAATATAQVRTEMRLEKGWLFTRQDVAEAARPDYDDKAWQSVTIPHDWAIYGPFDKQNDIQYTAIDQDGQKEKQEHAGRTGGLPWVGTGWYRLTLDSIPTMRADRQALLCFDGAMSHAEVYVNGKRVAERAYGYAPFVTDISDAVAERRAVCIAVRLENLPESSRWYPGAGLYRNVHLVVTDKVHIPVWGTFVTTPRVSENLADINVCTEIVAPQGTRDIRISTRLFDSAGREVAASETPCTAADSGVVNQTLRVIRPTLWSPDSPVLYKAVSRVYADGRLRDEVTTPFGIRSIAVVPGKGFYLNGRRTVMHDVCNHHDLGPLGAAVSEAALRYRLRLLKDMGCNAIRTAHNIPSPELIRLCDEMGFMVMAESFDEWRVPKMKNGYHLDFDRWAEADLSNGIKALRNAPSIVMWSIGNEIPEQTTTNGARTAHWLQDICHRIDPTRPCTQGMNNYGAFTGNFAAVMDVPGINYMSGNYRNIYDNYNPQDVLLGAETVSSFSSRGVYKLPVVRRLMPTYPDHQASSYDVEHSSWSDLPEDNFIQYEFLPYDMGEFVWTGFDYLGEPTPYYDNWPSHSSTFGIIDLAGLPKDRYYLYRSVWNPKAETLHILPHWNWAGHEQDTVPVFVYTNYPTVELFINGKSQGRRSKDMSITLENSTDGDSYWGLKRLKRYRLMWMDTRYEPGVIKAVAYDSTGRKMAEREIRTAGAPYRLELAADRDTITADGRDLSFITVRMVDKEGNLCPLSQELVKFKVKGAGVYRAGANGDPVNLEQFHLPQMHLFNGMMQMIVQSKETAGSITVEASAKGVKTGKLRLNSR